MFDIRNMSKSKQNYKIYNNNVHDLLLNKWLFDFYGLYINVLESWILFFLIYLYNHFL